MDFVGTGRRVSAAGIDAAARDIGCQVAAIQAVLAVEANGRGFDSRNRVRALFEPHKFYAFLGAGAKRNAAVAHGLAYRSWRPGNYPRTSDGVYEQIEAACLIDETAALRATSWGLGQILGDNYDECGFQSVQAFVEAMKEGEDRQLAVVCDLIQHWRLDDELQRLDWAGFARGWNGPRYRDNRYDEKLANEYRAAGGRRTAPDPRTLAAVVAMGQEGPEVGELQRLLNRAGFMTRVDNDFGNETKRQVRLYQLDRGLSPADGVVDQETLDSLRASAPLRPEPEREEAEASDLVAQGSTIARDGQSVTKIATGTAATVGAVKAADEAGVLDAVTAMADQAQAVGAQAERAGHAASQVGEAVGAAQQAAGTVASIAHLAAEYWWVIAVVALVAVAVLGSGIVKARVADHRTGKTL